MNIYDAARQVELWVKQNNPSSNKPLYVGYNQGQFLQFRDENEAVRLNDNSGWLFKVITDSDKVTVTPIG